MMRCRTTILTIAISLGLLLGCGAGQPTGGPSQGAAQAPPAQKPTAVQVPPVDVKAPSPAAKAPSPAAKASPAASPAASPKAAAPRAQLGPGSPAVRLDRVVGGLQAPVHVTHAGDGSGRLFVVEKRGRIRIVRNGVLEATPFLDITSLVESGGSEQGLLGVVFHPRYTQNGSFYVNYTNREGDSAIVRYQVSGDPNRADPNSAATLMTIDDPASNHNGGDLVFGPDGYLYIGMGDGGRAGDPWDNAQNLGTLLGKMLRIDVDGGQPYAIPPDNPLVGQSGARPEIWAYGLRNPWRYSFDRATGDFYIADVGQNAWEWVHLQRAGAGGGQNYGWNRIEGSHCFPPGRACDPAAYVLPIIEYDHSGGNCTVVGGYVYRGPSFPQLSGLYFYADFCSGRLWAAQETTPGQWRSEQLLQTQPRISSFGEDEAGEIYAAGYSDGIVYRLVAS